MPTEKSGLRNLGVAIYLQTPVSLSTETFVSEFRARWERTACEPKGETETCSRFKVGRSHVAIECRRIRVPDSVSNSVLQTGLHWPAAEEDIIAHKAHIAVAASSDDGDTLRLAADLTKTVVTLLSRSHSLCVCWLNGPALSRQDDFQGIATNLLGSGQPPLMLWVGLHWKNEGGLLYTKGMTQFGAPEIFLAQRSSVSEQEVRFLYDMVWRVLTQGYEPVDGAKINGPRGVFRVDYLQPNDSDKRAFYLVPMSPI